MSMSFQSSSGPVAINCRGVAGFTLIEIMTALVILTILMVVGIPAVVQMMAGQRAKSVAADLHTSLTLARAEAVIRNRQVTVSPLADDGDWAAGGWQVTVGAGADLLVLHRQDIETGLLEITPDPVATAITFRPNGRAGAAVTLEVESTRDASQRRCVEVGLDGRARSGACDDE